MFSDSVPQETSLSVEQTFRPSKRRKFYRKRADDHDEDNNEQPAEQVAHSPTSVTLDELVSSQGQPVSRSHLQEEITPSIADILRQRKALHRRKGGIDFTNEITATKLLPSYALIQQTPAEINGITADVEKVVNRFAPQTGQVADVNKHMYAISII